MINIFHYPYTSKRGYSFVHVSVHMLAMRISLYFMCIRTHVRPRYAQLRRALQT